MTELIEVFPWNKNFETGIDQIDEQHKVLVSLINLMASHLVNQSDIHTLDQIFTELTDYATYHFQSEERIWEEYLSGEPCLKGHKDTHGNFISSVIRLKKEEAHKSIDEVTEEILSFLTQWLAYHILDSDMRMSKIVFAVKAGLPVTQAEQQAEQEMSGAMRIMLETTLSMYDNLCKRTLELHREIVERKAMEGKLRLAANVFDHTLEAICITDSDSLIVDVNRAFFNTTGYKKDEVIGQHISALKSGLKENKLIDSI